MLRIQPAPPPSHSTAGLSPRNTRRLWKNCPIVLYALKHAGLISADEFLPCIPPSPRHCLSPSCLYTLPYVTALVGRLCAKYQQLLFLDMNQRKQKTTFQCQNKWLVALFAFINGNSFVLCDAHTIGPMAAFKKDFQFLGKKNMYCFCEVIGTHSRDSSFEDCMIVLRSQ